jgi:uncharacterized protein
MVDTRTGAGPPSADRQPRAGLVMFVLLSFGASWAIWLTASAFIPGGGQLAFLPGTIMPAIVALWLARRESEQSFRELLGRVVKWRVGAAYYAVALGFMATAKLAAAAIYRLDTGGWPEWGQTSLVVMMIGVLLSTPVQAGEEIGWRGFMLHRLAARIGFARSSLLVGLVWAAWHLPMFYMSGGNMVGQSFPFFLLLVTAMSVALAWLYWRTGSVLLTMIMHAAINNTSGIVSWRGGEAPDHVFAVAASPMAWITLLLLWIMATAMLVHMRGRRAFGP